MDMNIAMKYVTTPRYAHNHDRTTNNEQRIIRTTLSLSLFHHPNRVFHCACLMLRAFA